MQLGIQSSSVVVDVTVGLLFIWIILSFATLQIQEWISQRTNARAGFLEKTILNMLLDPQLVDIFYNHPMIRILCSPDSKGKLQKPPYIPNKTFAKAVLDVIVGPGISGESIDNLSLTEIQENLRRVAETNPNLSRLLDHIIKIQKTKTPDLQASNMEMIIAESIKNLEEWYLLAMQQASYWYKREAQKASFIIGLVLALIFNVDSIHIANYLWREPAMRQALIAQASYQEAQSIANLPSSLTIPIGWATISLNETSICQQGITITNGIIHIRRSGECLQLANIPPINDLWGWMIKLLGIFITAIAITQGSPLIFDILRKLTGIRVSYRSQDTGIS